MSGATAVSPETSIEAGQAGPGRSDRGDVLRRSEVRFRALVEHTSDIVTVYDEAGILRDASPALERSLGQPPRAWIGRDALDLAHPDDRRTVRLVFARLLQAPETARRVEFRAQHRDGSWRWLEVVAVNRLADPAVAGIVASARDVTERKQAEQAQRFMAEAGEVLAASLDDATTLQQVAGLVVPHLADWCSVHLRDRDGTVARLAVAHADPAKLAWAQELQQRYPPDADAPRGVPRVLRTARPELYPEITDAMLVAAAADEQQLALLRAVGMTSVMIVPLVARGRTLGAVSFIAAESGRRYGPAELAIAEELARRCALAMDNARLYQEAQAAEARYRGLFEGAADAIVVADAAGRYLDANPAAVALLGYGLAELRGLRVVDVVSAGPAAEHAHSFEAGRWSGELTVRRRDGSLVPVEAWTTAVSLPAGIVYRSALRDVSERRRFEAALRASEERYRHLFEHNPHPMWVIDSETLAFLAVNDAAVEQYGYSREEFLAMTARDIRPPEDATRLLALMGDLPAGYKPPRLWRHRKKDGTLIDVEVATHSLTFGGRPARIVLATDVTERLRAEAAIRRLNEELEARVRARTAELEATNQELEAFSYSVSHDLRAPLRAMDGYARIVLERHAPALPPEAQHHLRRVRHNATQMGALIDDLLAMSRLGRHPLGKRRVQPADLVRQVLADLAREQEGRRVEVAIADLPPCEADPALLKQVYANLLGNALKFTRTRPVAGIEVAWHADGALPGGGAYVVRDNGVGFDMAYADKLFGVFQRLHRAEDYEGTGVGLAIVQRIVHRHGGRVWAEATVDGGATFAFALPARPEPEEVPA